MSTSSWPKPAPSTLEANDPQSTDPEAAALEAAALETAAPDARAPELVELGVRPTTVGQELRVEGAGALGHGETRVFELEFLRRKREAFVLGFDGELLAYLNECPHWAVELDLGDGHFFDEELERIYCKNHGALFEPRSGACETGPCLGRSLDRFSARRDGDDAIVIVPDPDAKLVEA